MTFPASLRAFLLADSAIFALVGTRVYWIGKTEKITYPAILFRRSNVENKAAGLDGIPSIQTATVEIGVYTDGAPDELESAAAAIYSRLQGFKGSLAAGGTEVLACNRIGFRDDFLADVGAFGIVSEYAITYRV